MESMGLVVEILVLPTKNPAAGLPTAGRQI
jgi:hypothetical protein